MCFTKYLLYSIFSLFLLCAPNTIIYLFCHSPGILGCDKKSADTFIRHLSGLMEHKRIQLPCNCNRQFYISQKVWMFQHLCGSSKAPQAFQDTKERLQMWRKEGEGEGEGWVGVRRQKLSRLQGRGTQESDMAESIQISRDCDKKLDFM